MTQLEKLIANREELDREIEEILSSQSELAPVCEDTTDPTIYNDEDDYDIKNNDKCIVISNCTFDYSTTYTISNMFNRTINKTYNRNDANIDNRRKETSFSTSIAGGDSALGLIGGILEKLF